MSKKTKTHIKNIVLTLIILSASFGISVLLLRVLDLSEHITTFFAVAVFFVSLVTDGYLYGAVSAIAGVIIINYAFTYPYFGIDFTVPENIFSAVIMLIISFLASTLTTRVKHWQALKSEGEKERMRANLLRAVSHDLRTPLTTIYGASSSIVDNYDKLNDEQKKQMLRGITEDSQWLICMVENLLSVTRIDSGNVKLIKEDIVLEELIDSSIIKFKKRYPTQTVDVDIPDEIVIVPMDSILIEQVIINILENTVHHAEGFTRIVLKVFVIDKKAIFEISDNGCGIPKDRLETVFTGYNDRQDEPSDTRQRNAGIGLSVCASIIKAHGGTITAENSKKGGAIIRFALDITEDADEQ